MECITPLIKRVNWKGLISTMRLKNILFAATALLTFGTATWAVDSNPITITAIVPVVHTVTLKTASNLDWGTINLDPARTFVDGIAPGTTATPNAVANANDPWQTAGALKCTLDFQNNQPGSLLIYTNHAAQSYFTQHVVPGNLSATTNISGLIHVGGGTAATVGDSKITSQNAYLTTIPLRAWAAVNNEAVVTTNPSANWVWISDASTAYNGLSTGTPTERATKLADSKQSLLAYTLISKPNLDFYIRGAFSWPKYDGHYVGTVIVEWVPQ